ncbi:hypothetical protein HYV79_03630 [Candidatus Woesearchaeota archaeon]|nr:hypothetical protein [Candidatus Woesearchaeota archaeon]
MKDNAHLIQHEISHALGVRDRIKLQKNNDVMNYYPYFGNKWEKEDIQIMRSNCK